MAEKTLAVLLSAAACGALPPIQAEIPFGLRSKDTYFKMFRGKGASEVASEAVLSQVGPFSQASPSIPALLLPPRPPSLSRREDSAVQGCTRPCLGWA